MNITIYTFKDKFFILKWLILKSPTKMKKERKYLDGKVKEVDRENFPKMGQI